MEYGSETFGNSAQAFNQTLGKVARVTENWQIESERIDPFNMHERDTANRSK
jgi:hypothetical protein